MAIYHVNQQGEKVDPNTVAPLTPIFTVNTEEKGHEDFLKSLRGELKGDGVIRLSNPTPDEKAEVPDNSAPAPTAPARTPRTAGATQAPATPTPTS